MKKILTTFDYYLDYVIRTSGADEKIHSISTDYYFGVKENCRKYTHTVQTNPVKLWQQILSYFCHRGTFFNTA